MYKVIDFIDDLQSEGRGKCLIASHRTRQNKKPSLFEGLQQILVVQRWIIFNIPHLLRVAIICIAFSAICAHAQISTAPFTFATNDGAITITGYTGSGGVITIPSNIYVSGVSLPVAAIGDYAFDDNTNLTSVTIPGNVISIGQDAFGFCNLLTNVIIGDGVATIEPEAFLGCPLVSITIPASVTSIGSDAFAYSSIATIFFHGNAPATGSTIFLQGNLGIFVYYLAGTSGWTTTFSGQPTVMLVPPIYSFTGGNDGAYPEGALLLAGSTLYGTAAGGGNASNGTVFAVNTNGTGFTVLHSFTALSLPAFDNGTNSDGAIPGGGLILSGDTLYGTTEYGGSGGGGTVFTIKTNGTGFAVLHNFAPLPNPNLSTNSDGARPQTRLILSGGTLYGVTAMGSSQANGTAFALNTNGTGFTILHSFFDDTTQNNVQGGLFLSGNTLYGATFAGGLDDSGTIFAIDTTNSNFTTLHSFSMQQGDFPGSPNADGAYPTAGVIVSGNVLYGAAADGGPHGGGTLFSLNSDGSEFTILHSFDFNDGASPGTTLMLLGNTLCGMATYAGVGVGYETGPATMFVVNTNGANFTTLFNFGVRYNQADSAGAFPQPNLILSGNTVYGTAWRGGSSSNGAIFGLSLGSAIPSAVTFTANPTIGTSPLNVQFTSPDVDSLGSTITSWHWNFGDGAASTLQNPSHTFLAAGGFFPTLIATNSFGGTVTGSGPLITTTGSPVYLGLVLNGGFETGDFTGWTSGGNFVSTSVVSGPGAFGAAYAHSGTYGAQLGPSGSLGFISQTLPTAIGANYALSLWLDNPDGTTPNEFLVSWNGDTLFDETNLTSGWTNLQFSVSATGTSTILEIGFRDDPSFLGLDDISVLPVSLVNVSSVKFAGKDLVLNGINGVSGGTYHVLMATNLTLPFLQWTPVATNVLNASGNFTITVTNTVTLSIPQRFYVLQH